MIKKGGRRMDITLFSQKNQASVTVHSTEAKECFHVLEQDQSILRFDSNYLISDMDITISFEGLRTGYKNAEWLTDFIVTRTDGSSFVLEVLRNSSIANIQQLEMSRRYWSSKGMEWKVFVGKGYANESIL